MKFDESTLYHIETQLVGNRYSLFDTATWKNGLAFKKIDFTKFGMPIIKISELNNGITSTTAYSDKKYSPDVHLTKGDMVFSWSGNPKTSIDIYWYDLPDGWLNQHIFKVSPKKEVIDKHFFYYLMKYLKPTFTTIATNKQTTGLGHITIADLKRLSVIIPERGIQEKVALTLKSLDDKIELNNKINKNLAEQAQAIMNAFFISFDHFGGEMPDDWESGTLQSIADFSNGYAFKSKELLDTSVPDCYQVFKQGHINRGGGFNSSGTKSWYPISKCAGLSKYVLQKGDVLMAMTDMKDNVAILGNTALMTVDNQFIVNQRVGLLRSNRYKHTSFAYIYLLTNSFSFLKNLRSRANSGVQVNLSSAEIKNSPIVIASEEVNDEFNNLVMPLLELIMANDIESQHLSSVRDSLLPQLMSGKIDVSSLVI